MWVDKVAPKPMYSGFSYGYCSVRYPSWLSTENTRKSSITHALVSKVLSLSFIVHHFRISIILDCASILYLLYHFIYYKKPMYTTFSVVESIPPLTSRRRRPVSFSSPQSSPFRSVRQSSRLVKPRSREAPQFTHAQFTARKEHPSSPPASQPSAPTVPRISFSSYLRRPLGYSYRPSHNKYPENQSIDS